MTEALQLKLKNEMARISGLEGLELEFKVFFAKSLIGKYAGDAGISIEKAFDVCFRHLKELSRTELASISAQV